MNPESLPEQSDYQVAEEFKYTFKIRMEMLWVSIKTVTTIWVLLIPEALKGIKNTIIPPKPKCIKDQVVLITGGGNGLGRAIALRLAKEKCKLAIVDVDFSAAQKTAKDIETEFQIQALPFKADVSSHQAVNQLKADVEGTLGGVDILINNAGLLSLEQSLREGSPEDIQKTVNVNLVSHFWMLRAFLNGMVQRKRGHVVAICSMAGKITIPCAVAYCTTKHGLAGFMDALWDELCLLDQDFVKTTTAFPSFVNTRKDLSEKLTANGNVPRMDPAIVANNIVDGVLLNQRKIYIPKSTKSYTSINNLPDRIIRYIKVNMTDQSEMKKERSHIV